MSTSSKIVERHVACPNCTSSDAYCLYDDGHGHCFSCGQSTFPKKEPSEFTYEYVPLRGITKETLRLYDVKTKIAPDGKPVSIGFPYPNGSYKVRLLDKKEFYSQGDISKAGLFGRDKFAAGSHKYVIITEGEIDALSMHQVCKVPCVSVQSATNAVRDCGDCLDYLASFERIFLAFDNDAAGREAIRSVASLFDYNRTFVVKFTNRKDANEYLQANEAEELLNIWSNSKKYLPDVITSANSEFKRILFEEPARGISYPWPILNDMTYGIRRGESVLITAPEGIGKTELMHAIEHHTLKGTQENVGAIYLEEPRRRHLQALAGLELGKPAHLPDANCSNDQVYAALETLLATDERLFIYSHFGSDDPAVLLDTIRFLAVARNVCYFFLDHISIVVSGLAGDDERRALDYLSTRLEMMVKELNIALIMVSHVNDNGQTRGSRYIGKIADIRIDAQRDVLAVDPLVRNTTQLTVSKNRFSGKTGPADSLVFDTSKFAFAANDNFFPPKHQEIAS